MTQDKGKKKTEKGKLGEKELEDVSGGVYTRPIFKAASSCDCRSSCTHVNVTESSGSAGLSGDA